ncbi:NIPSNAP family protein [Sphingomonas sp. UYAg733]
MDPKQIAAFEDYARRWIPLVNKYGGTHHGYFLPGEGASDVALALFSFPNFATYEKYRTDVQLDPECKAALELADRTGCILRYDRSFMRPVFE